MSAIGFIIVYSRSRGDEGIPLSYGEGSEPAHNELLMRGAATVFRNVGMAHVALAESLKRQDADGSTWHKRGSFSIIPLRAAVPA